MKQHEELTVVCRTAEEEDFVDLDSFSCVHSVEHELQDDQEARQDERERHHDNEGTAVSISTNWI